MATEVPNSCYQPRLSILRESIRRNMSEDCLYLNIVVTKKALLDRDEKRAVMAWISPTDFLYGSGSDYPYLVPELPVSGDVVLVSLNYRKNVFGFIYHPKIPPLSGNLGLWDQNLALQWIKTNIEAFGGDPQLITAFGQESGSQSIANHILSPYAEDLFQNAIMMGSPAFLTVQDRANLRTELSTEIVLRRVSCWDKEDVLNCLQKLDPKELINALPNRPFPFTLIFGDEYLPYQMSDLLDLESFPDTIKRVNVLIGAGQNGAGIFTAWGSGNVYADQKLTRESAIQYIRGIFKQEAVPKLMNEYFKSFETTQEVQGGIIRLANDYGVRCPIYDYARKVAAQKAGGVYTYIINQRPKLSYWPQCTQNPEFGVCPGDSILYVFGVPFDRKSSYSNQDRAFSSMIMDIWSHFAKTG